MANHKVNISGAQTPVRFVLAGRLRSGYTFGNPVGGATWVDVPGAAVLVPNDELERLRYITQCGECPQAKCSDCPDKYERHYRS